MKDTHSYSGSWLTEKLSPRAICTTNTLIKTLSKANYCVPVRSSDEQWLLSDYSMDRKRRKTFPNQGLAQRLGTSPKIQGYERYEGAPFDSAHSFHSGHAQGRPLVLPGLLLRSASK